MRHPWLALPIAAVLSCNGSLLRISIEESATTLVPAGTLVEQLVTDFGFGEFLEMDLTDSSELQNQGVSPGDIQDVFLVDFVLRAAEPSGADLAFIDRLDVYVEAPEQPRLLIATQSVFPEGVAEVPFDLEDVDLTPYLVSQAMTLTTEVTGRRPDRDTTVEAMFAVSVGVTSQGVCNHLRKDDDTGRDG